MCLLSMHGVHPSLVVLPGHERDCTTGEPTDTEVEDILCEPTSYLLTVVLE